MSLFSSILSKLGIGTSKDTPARPAQQRAPAGPAAPSSTTSRPSGGGAPAGSGSAPPAAPTEPPASRQSASVDVAQVLEQRAKANPQKLNWRTSIVDLLKLLDIDSSLEARKALATELGCPADLMGDSAKMNMWLHKAVLARVAANGGKVPAELLD